MTSDYNGELEEMKFWGGKFKLGQKESEKPTVKVGLVGALGCKGGKSEAGQLLRRRGKKGHYRTRGRSGSATVRGAKWLTKDHCDGSTEFKLKRGRLAIDDFSIPGRVDEVLKNKGTDVAKPAR